MTWMRQDRLARGWVVRGLLVLLLTAVMGSGTEVLAQEEVADLSVYSTHRISMSRGHFDDLIATVFKDPEASEAQLAGGLYDGYTQGWAQASRTARNDLKMIRAKGRNQGTEGYARIQAEMRKRQQEFATEAKVLEEQFLADLQMFLTPAQAGRWGEFEQGRRRSLFLRRYRRLAGEDVDLIKLMRELDFALAEEVGTKVSTLLRRYGEELDFALQARQKILPEITRLLEAIRSGKSSQNGEQFYKSVVLPRHKALREINDRYAGELRVMLPAAAAEAFQDKFDRVRYPRIFATSQADRYLKKLRTLEDLTEKQDAEIERLLASYKIEVAPIIQRLMELQRDRDNAVPPQYRLANLAVMGGAGETEEGLELATAATGGSNSRIMELERQLWQRRREIEGRLIDAWFEVLTAAQRQEAPKTPLVFQPGGRPSGPHDSGGDDDGSGGGGK